MRSKLIGSLMAGLALMMAGLAVAQTNTADQAKPEIEAIRARAKTLSAKDNEASESKIDATIKDVDAEAAKEGSNVPDRLAKQLGMTPDALASEKAKFGTGFGGLMIAHLLLSKEPSASTVTLDDLFKMHEEGMGWGQIAHGMGLKLGGLVSAAKNEGRVATGNGKAASAGPHGAMGSNGASGAMEHGKSAMVPGHMGGGSAVGHGK